MTEHKCNDEHIRQMLYEVTYDMVVSIMKLIDRYSNYISDKHDIVNMVTGKRPKENPFIGLHNVLEGIFKN